MSKLSDLGRLVEMINGYQQTSIIVAALQVGLIDKLGEGPANEEDLAKALGAHPQSLSRLVRGLRVIGLVERRDDDTFVLTSGAKMLLENSGFTLRNWALLIGDEYMVAWANMRHSVMTGGVAFEHAFKTTAWEHRKQNPELNEHFNRVTTGVQLRTINALVNAYDFTKRRTIVDVGGGQGNLVAGILKRCPDVARGIIFDQPHVVEGAHALLDASVQARCEVVGGSFLDRDSIPRDADTYIMKHVLHNWDDDDCVTILRACGAAMAGDATSVLLVLENVLPEAREELRPPDATTAGALPLIMLDLHMMAVLGGRERTRSEYDALFTKADLVLERCIPTREGAPDILEVKRRS